jgi:C4-dicarboxylate-specific signal transduction histidine kinase
LQEGAAPPAATPASQGPATAGARGSDAIVITRVEPGKNDVRVQVDLATPASTASPTASPTAIVIPGSEPGKDITFDWDGGTLRFTQGTRELAIPTRDLIPPAAVDITIAVCGTLVMLVLGGPLLRHWLRRRERQQAQQQLDAAVAARLDALERHIDTVAVELERVSEGQRYLAKLQQAPQHAAVPARPT